MTGTILKGNWHVIKGRFKQKCARHNHNDHIYIEGKEEELYGRLQRKMGLKRHEFEKIMNGTSISRISDGRR